MNWPNKKKKNEGSMATEGTGEGFDFEESPDFEDALEWAGTAGTAASTVVGERTVDVRTDFDEDEFFSTASGATTVANRYDLERAVPFEKKRHFREVERYWVNKPYAFIVIFHSEKENEKKYYAVEPHLNGIEREVQEFLTGKLRTAIKYSEEGAERAGDEAGRKEVIESETRRLLKRYDLFEEPGKASWFGIPRRIGRLLGRERADDPDLEGINARPEPVLLEEDSETLTEYQVEKILYVLKRNFIGYERIDPIKHDINVEDISCDGYDSPVFVYHSSYEQIISNVFHGEEELDDFVVKLAQRSGKGISKRLPQVDATLPDGSRAQLTLGKEVSDHGTNYTIRQFKDVPFTPITVDVEGDDYSENIPLGSLTYRYGLSTIGYEGGGLFQGVDGEPDRSTVTSQPALTCGDDRAVVSVLVLDSDREHSIQAGATHRFTLVQEEIKSETSTGANGVSVGVSGSSHQGGWDAALNRNDWSDGHCDASTVVVRIVEATVEF